jgi:hypothetical protein
MWSNLLGWISALLIRSIRFHVCNCNYSFDLAMHGPAYIYSICICTASNSVGHKAHTKAHFMIMSYAPPLHQFRHPYSSKLGPSRNNWSSRGPPDPFSAYRLVPSSGAAVVALVSDNVARLTVRTTGPGESVHTILYL